MPQSIVSTHTRNVRGRTVVVRRHRRRSVGEGRDELDLFGAAEPLQQAADVVRDPYMVGRPVYQRFGVGVGHGVVYEPRKPNVAYGVEYGKTVPVNKRFIYISPRNISERAGSNLGKLKKRVSG